MQAGTAQKLGLELMNLAAKRQAKTKVAAPAKQLASAKHS